MGTNDTVLLAASEETKGMKWTQIPTAGIADDAMTATKIAADAVGSAEIAANAVGSSELADNAVDTAAIADGAVTAAKFAVQPGNLLTANQASIETDTTGFTASAATIARASGGAFGTYCLEVTATAASASVHLGGTILAGTIPVQGEETYTFRIEQKAASITRVVKLRVYWWTSAGDVAASTASVDSGGLALTSTWASQSFTTVAPANAAFASLRVFAVDSANAEVF
ncbi:MAG: hypothetical protein IPK85_03815, partial [Gemmatimonadetes bacterium]|nr:hypothetical protein [Gemmatimonadota bacterium]